MLSNAAFDAVSTMFQRVSGIQLGRAKHALVAGRLQKLAQARGIDSLDDYVSWLLESKDEVEMVRVVDKLTTNETYFFREPEHFDFLASRAEEHASSAGAFRVWSAASSSGEEAYSIAMTLEDQLGPTGWQVVGTDLSTSVVEAARVGLYPMERLRHVPQAYLKRFCRRGTGEYEGQALVCRELRDRVTFGCANLTQSLPDIGLFDVIFLRNVLIYFDPPGKEDIVKRVMTRLKPGGVLFTGHAESLNNATFGVRTVQPAIYERA